ncbi:MAG: cell division protein FtsH, partial [Acidimicrobiia bacterium]|nr:cell division protein FtsH [Acidimicrobiia bacterium]
VSIIPRGRALGWTQALPTEDRYLMHKSGMVDRLAMMLGGRVAEEIQFGDITTGASDDIEKATDLARKMVMEYGMSDRLGPMKYGQTQSEVFLGRDYGRSQDYSDEMASVIDEEIRKLIEKAHEEAHTILTTHKDVLDRLADALIERETVDADEVAMIFEPVKKWVHSPNGQRIHPAGSPIKPVTGISATQNLEGS